MNKVLILKQEKNEHLVKWMKSHKMGGMWLMGSGDKVQENESYPVDHTGCSPRLLAEAIHQHP